jgi:LacI family repressor for deo operon, udp, cdd, tsx, nupC, and nupG
VCQPRLGSVARVARRRGTACTTVGERTRRCVIAAASIEDVAKRAGVSIATVSRSLRGLPDVAEATRDRVLVAARDLDYVASPFAARLASGRTRTVGVVLPFVNRWFFAEVLGAVQDVSSAAGYDLLLHNLADEDGRAQFFAEQPFRKRVDAVLVVSLTLTDDELASLKTLQLPIAVLGASYPGLISTGIDDVGAARAAVRHLLALGHTRIALIGGDPDDPMLYAPPLHRRAGYLQALHEAGIDAEPGLERLGYFTVAGGESAMIEVLQCEHRPTAVFAESDEMAFGAMRAIRRAGLQIPHDIAVIGFDDQANAGLMDLTTIRQPVWSQGEEIAKALLESLTNGAPPAQMTMQTELVVRGSTDPSASEYLTS